MNRPIQEPASLYSPANEFKVPVALYARVSKDDDSQTPENQLIKLRERANLRGFHIQGEYIDYSSGADPNRPELERMLKDARDGKIHLILTVKLDRIARSMPNMYDMILELESYGVKFECIDQPQISTTSSHGKLMIAILGGFAEYERDIIRERTLAGLERARLDGKVLGRPCKHVDLAEVAVLLDSGLSLEEAARRLGVSEPTLRRRVKKEGVVRPNEISSKSPPSNTDDFDGKD